MVGLKTQDPLPPPREPASRVVRTQVPFGPRREKTWLGWLPQAGLLLPRPGVGADTGPCLEGPTPAPSRPTQVTPHPLPPLLVLLVGGA